MILLPETLLSSTLYNCNCLRTKCIWMAQYNIGRLPMNHTVIALRSTSTIIPYLVLKPLLRYSMRKCMTLIGNVQHAPNESSKVKHPKTTKWPLFLSAIRWSVQQTSDSLTWLPAIPQTRASIQQPQWMQHHRRSTSVRATSCDVHCAVTRSTARWSCRACTPCVRTVWRPTSASCTAPMLSTRAAAETRTWRPSTVPCAVRHGRSRPWTRPSHRQISSWSVGILCSCMQLMLRIQQTPTWYRANGSTSTGHDPADPWMWRRPSPPWCSKQLRSGGGLRSSSSYLLFCSQSRNKHWE